MARQVNNLRLGERLTDGLKYDAENISGAVGRFFFSILILDCDLYYCLL